MNELFDILNREGIFISYKRLEHLANGNLLGFYFYDAEREQPFIVLEKKIERSAILHRCVLAEEIGHYFTVPKSKFILPYTSYRDRLFLSIDERKALTWAAKFLISLRDLNAALRAGCETLDDFADYLNVTHEIAKIRLQLGDARECLSSWIRSRSDLS
ncbi:ImmA/IrrE family metallo-endopeptidase [Alicyclobacillus acidocaldarius]|uniref:ImmA/IrrE family metallo-endopeptidase n=1 Tax=Alicyclobacillus acidocaldarius TaxID=405212 RepID=UPI0009D934AD